MVHSYQMQIVYASGSQNGEINSIVLTIPTRGNIYTIDYMLHNAFWSDFQLDKETP